MIPQLLSATTRAIVVISQLYDDASRTYDDASITYDGPSTTEGPGPQLSAIDPTKIALQFVVNNKPQLSSII